MSQKRFDIPISQYFNLLITYLRHQKGRAALLGILLLGGITLQLINPQLVRVFLDAAEQRAGLNRLVGAAAIFLVLALTRHLVNLAAIYVGENVAWTATNQLRADLALHCLRLDMSFHKKYKPGELIERVDGDVNQLATFFSQLVILLGGNLLLVGGILILLFFVDWRIGLAMTAVSIPGLLALDWLNKRSVPRWQALRQANADLFGSIEEWLNGTEEIRSSSAEPYIMRRLYELMRRRWLRILSAMRISVLVNDLPFGVFALAYVAAHILGAAVFREGAISIGTLYLIFYYLDTMKGPLWEILHQVEGLQQATASINRIAELRGERPRIVDGPGADLPAGPLAVWFDRVSFHYEDDVESLVLNDLDFTLAPGAVLGLLGHTGSGKTTLTKLLFRFYDPVSGAIRLGAGNQRPDLRELKLADLRGKIGMVTQDVQIFRATVRQNLSLFDPAITDEDIRRVVVEVGMGGWLDSLPDGLNTRLDTGSSGLSAGQAQLLAFARVFLSNPGLVILDEASSRLDPVTEQHIEQAIDRLLKDRTAIIIAHRLGTVQRADEIMILDDGQVSEHGRRIDLLDDPSSRFYQLMQVGLEEVFA